MYLLDQATMIVPLALESHAHSYRDQEQVCPTASETERVNDIPKATRRMSWTVLLASLSAVALNLGNETSIFDNQQVERPLKSVGGQLGQTVNPVAVPQTHLWSKE